MPAMIIRKKYYVLQLIVTLFALALSSCDCTNDTQTTAAESTANGWKLYTTRDYSGALSSFQEAIGLDETYTDAYNGAGWTYAKMNDMNSAVSNFTNGLHHDQANLEIQAGLSFVYNARKSYPLSIDAAQAVLAADAGWAFSHDTSIAASDVRLVLAQDYFAQGQYALSRDQVHLLDASVPADLDVSTPAGVGTLARAIERLRSSV
jgi:tetratricopeptide (TPR) repeat protein